MVKRARQHEKAGRFTNEDGYKVFRVSENHWKTTAGMGEGDSVTIRKAVEERWPVRKEAREPLADMLLRIALDNEQKADSKIQAARTVLTMEAQNQKDEHLIYQHENAQPQLHVHTAVDPEQCRTEILQAIDAEIERRELPPADEAEGNGRQRGNGDTAP